MVGAAGTGTLGKISEAGVRAVQDAIIEEVCRPLATPDGKTPFMLGSTLQDCRKLAIASASIIGGKDGSFSPCLDTECASSK